MGEASSVKVMIWKYRYEVRENVSPADEGLRE